MNLSVVMYRNPLQEWFWESGAAYWFYGILIALVLAAFICLTSDNKK